MMIAFDQWVLPEGETHLQQWMTRMQQRRAGRLCYQLHKYNAALDYCPMPRRTAVDCGAHVGLWSYWMAQDFAELHAFEPHPEHRLCWGVNMMGHRANTHLYAVALGAENGAVALATGPSSSGDTYVVPKERLNGSSVLPIPLMRLDDYPLREVDFLKIDCEGGEFGVVQGGLETIRRWHPVIIVEQKPGHGAKYGISDTAARELLITEGYVLRQTISGDDILTWGQL